MFWTPKQRVALSVVIAAILLLLVIRYSQNRTYIANPQPPEGLELLDRIDPNTADESTLAALPNIGPAMARRIVEEREQYRLAHPDHPPYRQISDLDRVKGIGPATIENLRPYLTFPAIGPTTQPAPNL
jgi:competence protein ComEA